MTRKLFRAYNGISYHEWKYKDVECNRQMLVMLFSMSQETPKRGVLQRFTSVSSFIVFSILWQAVFVGLFWDVLGFWVPFVYGFTVVYEIAYFLALYALYSNKRILLQCSGVLQLLAAIAFVIVAVLYLVPLLPSRSPFNQFLIWSGSIAHTLLNGVMCVYVYLCSRLPKQTQDESTTV
jgi:glucan phosphoethanolaminetransferase (alkaline phosphatase superfamily)